MVRGGEPVSLVLLAMDEIDGLKRTLDALTKRLEALEGRVAGLEKPTA